MARAHLHLNALTPKIFVQLSSDEHLGRCTYLRFQPDMRWEEFAKMVETQVGVLDDQCVRLWSLSSSKFGDSGDHFSSWAPLLTATPIYTHRRRSMPVGKRPAAHFNTRAILVAQPLHKTGICNSSDWQSLIIVHMPYC